MSDLIQMPHAAVLPVIRSAVTPGTGWELFNPLSLDPLVYFDALGGSMLDSGGAAASHGDNVATLTDLGANGDDATQSTDSLRPVALTETGLYLPGVAYNYASVPDSVALDITGDLDLRAKITLESFTPAADGDLIAKYITTGNQRAFRLLVNTSGQLHFIHSPTGTGFSGNTATSSVALPTDNLTLWVRAIKSESLKNVTFFTSTDGENWSQLGVPQSITSGTTFSSSAFLEVGSNNSGINTGFSHVIHRVQIFASTDGTDKRLDIDFTNPSDAHGATSFTAETGQTVTINQSGDNPATLIRHPVARFDGSDDYLSGTFGSTVTGGWMFAVFEVLGSGGENFGRVLSCAEATGADNDADGCRWSMTGSGGELISITSINTNMTHTGGFSGRVIHDALQSNGAQNSTRNGADEKTATDTVSMSLDRFSIGGSASDGTLNPAIDLHHLSLYPASLTAAEATKIRNYLNNRYNVY